MFAAVSIVFINLIALSSKLSFSHHAAEGESHTRWKVAAGNSWVAKSCRPNDATEDMFLNFHWHQADFAHNIKNCALFLDVKSGATMFFFFKFAYVS